MKIVHLIWGLEVGGAETMLVDIAGAQSREHQVWLVIGNDDVDPALLAALPDPVHRVVIGRPPGSRNPWYTLRLLAALWRIAPDVVHVHQESFLRLKRFIPAPLLLTVHATQSSLPAGLADFDSVCCISEAVSASVRARVPACRTRVIHNGIDFSALKVKKSYGARPFRIVQVSRLDHETKGQDLLIGALELVHRTLGEASVSVDFIGEGSSRGFLVGLAASSNLAGRCRFLGLLSRREIFGRLADYDLLVQPSRSEGFGLSIVEGIAAGVPVLVSEIEGPLEVIEAGRLGCSFRSGDVADLAAKIIELVGESGQQDFALRMQARIGRAASRYDVALTAQAYVEEYRSLAREGNRRET
jgi:glycosyltransferase involved in cell wall biosynthesis